MLKISLFTLPLAILAQARSGIRILVIFFFHPPSAALFRYSSLVHSYTASLLRCALELFDVQRVEGLVVHIRALLLEGASFMGPTYPTLFHPLRLIALLVYGLA